MGQLLSNLVRMPIYGICFLAHNSAIIGSIWMTFYKRVEHKKLTSVKVISVGGVSDLRGGCRFLNRFYNINLN